MKQKFSKISDIPVLAVFAVFAVSVLLVLLWGAKIYGNLVRRGGENFQRRTAAQYVANRVRQAESVTVTEFDGCRALAISETNDGKTYVTYVYCHDGFLRELYCAQGAALLPEDGEKVIAAENMEIFEEAGLLEITVDKTGMFLNLRGKEGGAS